MDSETKNKNPFEKNDSSLEKLTKKILKILNGFWEDFYDQNDEKLKDTLTVVRDIEILRALNSLTESELKRFLEILKKKAALTNSPYTIAYTIVCELLSKK